MYEHNGTSSMGITIQTSNIIKLQYSYCAVHV